MVVVIDIVVEDFLEEATKVVLEHPAHAVGGGVGEEVGDLFIGGTF